MFANLHDDQSSQNSAVYVNRKRINELFEAIMIALMVHKPDDHISFIRECLDKVKRNHSHIPWNSFVIKSTGFSIDRMKKKPLPSIVSTTPIIFILSSLGITKLCSRLLEHYHQLKYLLINDIGNIDGNKSINLRQYQHRYECIQNEIKEHRLQSNGFLIAGELKEQEYLEQWQEKLGRIDLIVILYSNSYQKILNRNFNIIQIDLNNDFEDILNLIIHHFDKLFLRNVSHNNYFTKIPTIIFCIDHCYRSNNCQNLLIDNEFEIFDDEEKNNSFISTLCHRLAEQFSFKYIHYQDLHGNFSKLKNEIRISMNIYSGYIIDQFPISLNDFRRFQSEIGQCSVLIYTNNHQQKSIQTDEINEIIEEFQMKNRAIYIDCRMEVDEIYDDLKHEILKHL